MKKHYRILFALFLSFAVFSCQSDDDALINLDGIAAPANLGASFQIAQDNSGLVSITPTGEGAVTYTIDFGDGSPASEAIKVGESVEHVYAEGEYDVTVTGTNLAGKTATGVQPLTVSFLAPENLETEIVKDANDNYTISVSASAQNAAMFEVYFGENEDEEPTPLMPGESVSYTYSSIGTYNVRVVALSGGAATTEVVREVSITDPLFLPIDFESETLNYSFDNFGGGEGAGAPVIDNPDSSGINTSAKVASYTKPAGSEVWAGSTIALDEPIDFSTNRYISVDVWSPIAGAEVLFKIENLGNSEIFVESFATTTVSEGWETLTFDMNEIDPSVDYGRIALFFNFGVSGTGETYYFDNIKTTRLELVRLSLTFESENTAYVWNGFGGAGASVIDNPDASGLNTSAKVTELGKGNGAETWAGVAMDLDEALNFANGTTITMKTWSPKAGAPILLKFEDSQSEPDGNGNPSVFVEVIQNTTVANEWEEMTFDLSSFEAFDENISYDRIIVFYDFGNVGEGSSFYFDDVRLGDAQTDYISLFSDFAEDVPVDTWRTDWSAADYAEVEFDGGLVKQYNNLDFVGIETVANQIDASAMTHFHTEIYTGNATTFRVKLVDFGPDGGFGGGDDTEHEVVFDDLPLNEWVSLDIPLSTFENLQNRQNIAQLIYSAVPAGEANVYLRNIYFHN
ncbi:PKD domain-containing protein [Salegentibacter sp. HM20]